MMLVPTPRPVASIWAPKTPAESRTNRPTRFSAIEPLGARDGGAGRVQGIEPVLAFTQHGIALGGDEAAPQAADRRLEGIAGGGERREIDRDVAHAEVAGGFGQRRSRLDRAVVDQPLLEIAAEHERALDVVRVRDLLEDKDPSGRRHSDVRPLPECVARRVATQELAGREPADGDADLVRP